jgi:hypothetical protein
MTDTHDRNTNNNDTASNETALNAALQAWEVPPPSPWLKTRATQALIARRRLEARQSPWPFAPWRLAGMATAAALMGAVLGATLPGAPGIEPGTEQAVGDVAMDNVNTAPADETEVLVSELW